MRFNKKHIERIIERERKRMAPLLDNVEDLSKWGHWTIGYCSGRISLLEELLEEMEDLGDERTSNN